MKIQPIRDDEKLRKALAFIEANFDAPPGSAIGDQVEVWAILVEHYEQATIDLSLDPIEAIEVRMQDLDLTRADLMPVFGTRGRVSEVLNRKRRLSLEQMRALATLLTLPLDVLATPYKLAGEKRGAAAKRSTSRVAGRKPPVRRAA